MITCAARLRCGYCSVSRVRNHFCILIGLSSVTRHRSFNAIGPPLQLSRVVVIPVLRLATDTQDSVGLTLAVRAVIGQPDGRCGPRPACPHK